MRYAICVWSLLFVFPLFGQGIVNDYISLNEELVKIGFKEQNKYSDLEGSPYWEEEYIPVKIERNGKKLLSAFMRYNILKDEVQIKVDPEDEKSYRLPRWGELEYITSEYSYFLSHKVTEDSTSVYGYFIKYFGSEKVQFYGKPVAKVLPAQSPETSYDRGRPATIQVISRFYIQIDHEPLKEVKIRERDFRKLFGNSKVMRMYFKEHKVNKIEDIVEMLRFYEESV